MSSPPALLSVSRLGAGILGLFYGLVHQGSLETRLAKEHAAHPEFAGAHGQGVMAQPAAETGSSLNPQVHTTPGH